MKGTLVASLHAPHVSRRKGHALSADKAGAWLLRQGLKRVCCVCRGVLNRDLKPENLLLKRKHTCQEARCTMENLRCVDFGSAAALENGEAP